MASGVLACKTKKERLKPLFFIFYAQNFPCSTNRPEWIESSKLHSLRAGFLLAASVGGA
jgi:hypothetical protein